MSGGRRALAFLAGLLVLLVSSAVAGGLWLIDRGHARLDGELRLDCLQAPARIERDGDGVPTVHAASRADLACATGFLHGQDRFFQMDLLRRRAAGELAALVGPAALELDRSVRLHRFRDFARRSYEHVHGERRALLDRYAQGVAAGLAALDGRPPEYLALGVEPRPWLAEESYLAVAAMYLDLQQGAWRAELDRARLREAFPEEVVTFLDRPGGPWDAPIDGEPFAELPIPEFDLRARLAALPPAENARIELDGDVATGSNNWAVSGDWSAHGGAIVADDMHLGLGLPNVWYRISLVGPELRLDGVTLPGAPILVVGSNGHIATAFTNSYGDWYDIVELELDPDDPTRYRSAEGWRSFERHESTIESKGGASETHLVEWTEWGPRIDDDHALAWVAHRLEGINLRSLDMEGARSVDEALRLAVGAGIPAQNLVVGDSTGRIGWTIMGAIPRREGFDGSVPTSWADGTRGWRGFLAADAHPAVVDPPGGLIWTANARVGGGEALAAIGDGGYALGARARQIRDALAALEAGTVTEADLLAIQLDDRALFLERWRDWMLANVDGELRATIEQDWNGRASIDSAGYRLVRAFRLYMADAVLGPIDRAAGEGFRYRRMTNQWEPVLWSLIDERPTSWLDPEHDDWQALIESVSTRVVETFLDGTRTSLAEARWGDRNRARIAHPLSGAVPQLSRWLDLPTEPLPGDAHMPRVQSITFGASQRMVVAPGHEDRAIFHMPGGASGHFRSPFYTAGHRDWAEGRPSPLRGGPTEHTLELVPAPAR